MKLFDLTKREKMTIGIGAVVVGILMGGLWAVVSAGGTGLLMWTLRPDKKVYVTKVTEEKKK